MQRARVVLNCMTPIEIFSEGSPIQNSLRPRKWHTVLVAGLLF